MKIACFVAAALMSVSCLAQSEAPEILPAAPTTGEHAEHVLPYPHPTLPAADTQWPVPMMIVVLFLGFLLAAIIGPLYRMEMPTEEEPADHAHGDDHGHGHAVHH